MHALSFGLKRAHLRVTEMLKPVAAEFDLTPARFDILYVLRSRAGACLQSELWKRLGVARQTMSKMLKKMEEKGLVWRSDEGKRRRREVTLTMYGLEQLVAAAKYVFRTEEVRRHFDAIHEEGRAFVAKAAEIVREIGRAMRDTAKHYYSVDAHDAVTVANIDAAVARIRIDVERLEELRPVKNNAGNGYVDDVPEDDLDLAVGDVYDSQATLADLYPSEERDT